MIEAVMTPPSPTGHRVELTAAELEALIRWHRLEAIVGTNGDLSRQHMARADRLRRVLEDGS